MKHVAEDECVNYEISRSSLVFLQSYKDINSNFCKFKDKKYSNEAHANTCVSVAFVLPCHACHSRNPIEQGCEISLQMQFEITKYRKTQNTHQMVTHDAAIKMDNEDPLCQCIECQVEMILMKLLIWANSGDSSTLEGSEKVLCKNVIGLSSDKYIEKEKRIF